MIIDCHGHYTTAPKALENWRDRQIAGIKDPAAMPKVGDLKIGDDELRESIESNQLKLMRQRGSDLTIFSPRASFMAHHIGDFNVSSTWAAVCNELCYRVAQLFPDNFVGAAMLPQSPGVDPKTCIPELEKCVREYGFVGINLNPDPSGGHWKEPPLSDRRWYPIYEKMVEHDIPAMIHVSTSCNPCFHTTGAHYLNADTTAFMQCLDLGPVQGFPDAALHHSARRRRGALSLGPLPRPRAGAEETAPEGPSASQRLLRHLRLPPAGHRPADPRDPGRQHPVRERDDRRRARHRSGDRQLLRRHQALHRGLEPERGRQAQGVRRQRAARVPAPGRGAQGQGPLYERETDGIPEDPRLAGLVRQPVEAAIQACRPAAWTRIATCSGRARSFPTRRSASTRPATRRSSSSMRCATTSASRATSSCRRPATAPTTARWSMRSCIRAAGHAAWRPYDGR